MRRSLPAKGFYVWNILKWAAKEKLSGEKLERILSMKQDISIIYSSGTTKNNFYYQPAHHGDQWNHLIWTCLPSIKDAEDFYDFYQANPSEKELPIEE